jgi:hypothetical protein
MHRSTIALVVITIAVVVAAVLLRSNDDAPTEDLRPQTNDQRPTTLATTTSTTAFAPVVPTLTVPDGRAVCDLYSTVEVTGAVESPDLVEASGLTHSRTTPGVMWAHNDSRDGPRLYALGTDGSDLGTFEIPNAFAFDWEDIAAGPDARGLGSFIYVGDIGDNFGIRDGLITLHRVEDIDPAELSRSFPNSAPIALSYPDGIFNAEALFIDPVDPAAYVITKSRTEAFVYRGSIELVDGAAEMELVATLFLDAEVSGADISADGSLIAFRGYNTVWMWQRTEGQSIAQALAAEPCEAPHPEERQGESIAIDRDLNYWTVSEGTHKDINFIRYEG